MSRDDGMGFRSRSSGVAMLNPSYKDSKLHEIATLMAKDSDFAIFRKFSELNFFNLLHIQHSLIGLEKELCENLEHRLDVTKVAIEIRGLLKEYNAAYMALSALRDAHKPSDNTLSVIGRFSDSHLRDFREELGDLDRLPSSRLMSLAATDKSWAGKFMDDHPFLQKMFKIDDLENDTVGIRYFSDTKYKAFVASLERFLITIGFCILLLGPIYWLSYAKNTLTKLGIVAGFVVSVALFTAGLTRAQYWEICTVTAGYCAILVVFLSSGIGYTV